MAGTCCLNTKVATSDAGVKTCCTGATPVPSNGICCPSGKVNKDGICCTSSQVNATGICCAATKPYNVSGTCSLCNAAGRVKISGSLEADKCCPAGNVACTTASGKVVSAKTCTCECPAGKQDVAGKCCSNTKVATSDAGVKTCCTGTTPVLSENHCCANGKLWASLSNKCCSSTKIADDKTCCQGTTPLLSSGICCPADKYRAGTSNICCYPGQTESGGVCQNSCRLYQANFSIGSEHNVKYDTEAEALTTISSWNSTAKSGPSCLQSEIDKTLAAGIEMAKMYAACKNKAILTSGRDNSAIIMMIGLDMFGATINTLIRDNWLDTSRCSYGSAAYYPSFSTKAECLANGKVHDWYYCKSSVAYFDKDCQAVDKTVVDALCNGVKLLGSFNFIGSMATPISFVWEVGVDIESAISLVDFPLDPNKIGKKWLWKASEKAPLLVYDPEHQGMIKDGTQLFGNWTFGGVKLASLLSSGLQTTKAVPWNNGYESLETLDSNDDGYLSQGELKSLALWFDKGSDGISSKGEVVNVGDLGITKIFLNYDSKDELTGNISASIGFERLVDGQLVKGSSIDWVTKGADTNQELLLRQFYLNQSADQNIGSPKIENKDAKPEASEKSAEDILTKFGPLTGVWKWKYVDQYSDLKSSDGFFLLHEDMDSKIIGYTVMEAPFGDGKKVASAVLRYRLEGKKNAGANNQEIQFKTVLANGNVLNSTAKIGDNNETLVGQSTATTKDTNGKEKTLTYRWEAKKYYGKSK